jgi:hypothetical protein
MDLRIGRGRWCGAEMHVSKHSFGMERLIIPKDLK